MADSAGMLPRNPTEVPCRTVAEWPLSSRRAYASPFADIAVDVTFTSPSGRDLRIPAFYDGAVTWRVRFNPGEPGRWGFQSRSVPSDPALEHQGAFNVTPRQARGFLTATPGQG
jgi:hypothetical protein